MMSLKSILIDSNVWINIWQGNQQAKSFLDFVLKHQYTLIVTEHILSELTRKITQNKEKILAWFLKLHPKEIRILHDKDSVREEATRLSNSYSFCHYPDNRILASCKENTAVLVTFDKKLLLSADFEGVLACTPHNFQRLYT